MDTTSFLALKPETVKIQPALVKTTRDYVIFQRIGAFSEYVDFGCNMVDGVCSNTIPDCCDLCAENFGYLKFMSEDDIDSYAAAYDEVTGFKGASGCKITRIMRSHNCNMYACPAAQATKIVEYSENVQAIRFLLQDVESNIQNTEINT